MSKPPKEAFTVPYSHISAHTGKVNIYGFFRISSQGRTGLHSQPESSSEETTLKRKQRKNLWLEAVKDPLFVKDMEDIEKDFRYADAEIAREIDR